MNIKDSEYVKINNVNPLYLIFSKVNGYFEEINGSKYLTLVPTNKSKEVIKKYQGVWSKMRDLIGSITKKPDHYNEKTTDIPIMIIVFRAIFYENNKYYSQVLLNECFYKLQLLAFTVI